MRFFFFFFNDTATTEIYTLSLHDALPIYTSTHGALGALAFGIGTSEVEHVLATQTLLVRSEEHTSELQSPCNLVCRLLLEKKKKVNIDSHGLRTMPIHGNNQTNDGNTCQ